MASYARVKDTRFRAENAENLEIPALVEETIEPFRKSKEKPPFTMEELVVMALMEKPRSAKSVQKWIFLTFNYYRDMAFKEVWHISVDSWAHSSDLAMTDFSLEFKDVFRTYDIPLKKVEGDSHGISLASDKWSVPTNQGMVFLRNLLLRCKAQMTEKPFRFLDLPPELRERIYSVVLSLPRSGVDVGRRRMSFCAKTRAHDEPFEFGDTMSYVYKCKPPSQQLAILLCNKQIFQEAKHLFYSINTFICRDLDALDAMLRHLAPERRKHLGHVALKYELVYSGYLAAIKLLGEIEHLRELDIGIDEDEWLATTKRDGTLKYPTIMDIPGIRILRRMRGLKRVTFHGDCEKIKAAVEKEMVKPMIQKKAREGRKRKAANETETSNKGKKIFSRSQKG